MPPPAEAPRPLAGRTALVTGVSRRIGLGFAIAGRLAEAGADLLVASWRPHDEERPWGADPSDPEALAAELRETGRRVEHRSVDLEEPTAPGRLVDAAVATFGHLDIVVANHARSARGTLDEVTAEELDRSFAVNARATILLAQALAARHDGRPGGRLVMLTSGQHRGPMPEEVAYVVSKGAVHQATVTLSAHLARRGITVNTINPGPTDTGYADAETRRAVVERMPFGRWGLPDDAARLVRWLCTDEAAWITGQVIDSDGGFGS